MSVNKRLKAAAQAIDELFPDQAGTRERYAHLLAAVQGSETVSPPRAIRAEFVADAPALAPTCHVLVRAETEDARERARRILTEAGQDPSEVWSTPHAVSFRVSALDPGLLRRRLEPTALDSWTVLPADRAGYLLHLLHVQGPDGRQWRITDAPAAQPVGDIAAEIVEQYGPDTDAEVPRVS